MTMKKIKLFDYQEDMVKRVQEAFNFLHVSYGIFRKLSYLCPDLMRSLHIFRYKIVCYCKSFYAFAIA